MNLIRDGLFWGLVVTIWQVSFSTGLVNEAFFSSPGNILSTLFKFSFWQLFALDLVTTFQLLWLGLVIGYLLALFLGFLTILIPASHRPISQINTIFKFLPPPILIPIGIVFFGINQNTKLFVPALSATLLYLNYFLETVEKEERVYANLQTSWQNSNLQRVKNFVWPITNHLNYRIIPALVMWVVGITLITEIVLGGNLGLGVSLWRFQQLYDTPNLYTYIALILLISISLEKILVWYFARLRWDFKKMFGGVCILIFTLFSVLFQISTQSTTDPSKTILTYPGAVNLPLLVYQEKFNTLDLQIQEVASGTQVMNGLQSGEAAIGGYADIPNVIAGINQNSNLKIISQLTEQPDHPSLFFLSNRELSEDNFSALNNSTIGYYPNNPLIKSGLEIVLLSYGVRTPSLEFTSSNDPSTLNQSFEAGQISALVTLEPYATDIEKANNIQRINPDETIIAGLSFSNLPLAGLVANTDILSQSDIKEFNTGLTKSVDFINNNINENKKATGELLEILQKNDLDEDILISNFESRNSIKPENIDQIITLMKLLNLENIDELKSDDLYLDIS